MKGVAAKRAVKVLKKNGWVHEHTRGSHYYFKHPKKPGMVCVPMHGGDLKRGTLMSILTTSGISIDEF